MGAAEEQSAARLRRAERPPASERGAARTRIQEEAAGLEAGEEGSTIGREHRAAARQPPTADRLAALALLVET